MAVRVWSANVASATFTMSQDEAIGHRIDTGLSCTDDPKDLH
jgi:hypothetical protein